MVRQKPSDHSPSNKKHGIRKRIKQQLESYCDKTTLHGLRYVGDSTLSFGERIFWLISFSLAITFAAYYISNIYDKWKSSPVIISFSPFDADLSSIPFPAITICNMNQAKKNEAERILSEGTNIEKKLLDDSCNGNATYNGTENIGWDSVRNFLVKAGNSCSDMLKQCTWRSDRLSCEDVFNNDLTDEGLCCSFNRLPPDSIFRNSKDISILNQTYPDKVYNWNPEIGFTEKEDGSDYIPRRPLGAGSHLGLSIILDAQIDNYYCSSTKSVGFKVLLSNPIETPKMADFAFFISPGLETRVAIEPSVREATETLRPIPIEKRQCYFANERPLQYYRSYTMKNCELECQTRFTLRRCGCVPYYFPRRNTTKVCTFDDPCIKKAKILMDQLTYVNGIKVNCTCLPSCSNIQFKTKKTSSKLYTEIPVENMDPTYFEIYSWKSCILECQSNYTLERCGCVPYYLPKNKLIKFCGKNEKSCVSEAKGSIESTAGNVSYTQRNCNHECQSNHTYKSCKCIPYYLPKNATIKFCGRKDLACVQQSSEDMEITYGNGSSCGCLPACFQVNYSKSKSFGKLSNIIPAGVSKDEIIDANVGGLLGLCLGFSFLSVIEIVYFFFIRVPFMHLRKKFRIKKSHNHNKVGKHNTRMQIRSDYPNLK